MIVLTAMHTFSLYPPLAAPDLDHINQVDPDLAPIVLDNNVHIPGVDVHADANNHGGNLDDINIANDDINIAANMNNNVDGANNVILPDNDIEIPGVVDAANGDDAIEIPGAVGTANADNAIEIPGVGNDDAHDAPLTAQMDAAYGERTGTYDLRPRRPRNYDHLFTQHSIKKGLRIFGDEGSAAVIKELKQLHDLKVIVPIDSKAMTREEKSKALQYLMFLKKKRCGRIKGRGCADGRKQRTYLSKEETSSPTVATESVYLSCVIDADEGRDVAIVDIPGAFLHADMNELIYMRIDGDMARMLIDIDPDTYTQYANKTENGQLVLYVRLEKALYGTLQAALLFWEKLSGVLSSWGFVINPYDRCVANKLINGSICTILWHVDDLKISHADPNVVSDVIEQLSTEFGSIAPLTVHRGQKHDYLGMELDFSTPKKGPH